MNPKPEGGAVVLFLCHYLSERLTAEFSRLATECVGLAEPIYALDVTKGMPEELPPELVGRLFTFTQDDLSRLGYPHKCQGTFIGGNADLMLQLFHRCHPGYRHYWVVEYDVRYSGPWSEFLGHFAGSDADLLCTTLTRHAGSPHWYYWRSLRPPAGEILARADMIRGFMPIYRLSAAALETMDAAYAAGWGGHYEATLPTLLHRAGLLIEDLGGEGEFVRPENRGRFYRNRPRRASLSPGTFVFRPVRAAHGREPSMLWHPVKAPGETPWDAAYRRRLRRWILRRLGIGLAALLLLAAALTHLW